MAVQTSASTRQLARTLSLAALIVAGVVVVLVLLGSDGEYKVSARFQDAGQLVNGNQVQVAGRPVGTITKLRLTDDNHAEVVMKITDRAYRPLPEGTVATIRQVGLGGVANRYVELSPGPAGGTTLRNGATLRTNQTQGIVDLDQVLNALDQPTRTRLQTIIRQSAHAFAGNSGHANRALGYLNPALTQTAGLADELASDQVALERLIRTSGEVAAAVGARTPDLEQGVANTATALSAVAGERAALEDSLARAPFVLGRALPTLRRLRRTLVVVRPALREARPVALPLARVLRALPSAARNSTPVVRELRRLLPDLRRTLVAFVPLARELVPTINQTVQAARGMLPIFRGLRIYAPDLVSGLYLGFGGVSGGYYDANGHYARIAANFGASAISGLGSLLPIPGVPGTVEYRTGLTARCPGAAAEPAPDGSNPWVADASLCNPAHSKR